MAQLMGVADELLSALAAYSSEYAAEQVAQWQRVLSNASLFKGHASLFFFEFLVLKVSLSVLGRIPESRRSVYV